MLSIRMSVEIGCSVQRGSDTKTAAARRDPPIQIPGVKYRSTSDALIVTVPREYREPHARSRESVEMLRHLHGPECPPAHSPPPHHRPCGPRCAPAGVWKFQSRRQPATWTPVGPAAL